MTKNQWSQTEAGKPARYRITVTGCLSESWSGRLGGMRIAARQENDPQAITILEGLVQDQSELIGVLNTLHQIRVKILSVNCEAGHRSPVI